MVLAFFLNYDQGLQGLKKKYQLKKTQNELFHCPVTQCGFGKFFNFNTGPLNMHMKFCY